MGGTMRPLRYGLDLVGVFVFALSGGLTAARKELDPVGFLLRAIVVASTILPHRPGQPGGLQPGVLGSSWASRPMPSRVHSRSAVITHLGVTHTVPDEALPAERARLAGADRGEQRWRFWGPYLSERQWGTVREDYGAYGNPWGYFPHDPARSRAYRWGEDGIAGISDDQQRLCLALALWNGRDPILKERLFGLSNGEGNHGEDV